MRTINIIVFFITISVMGYTQDTLRIFVAGECDMCKDRIEEVSLNTIGVSSANYELSKNELTVVFDKVLFNRGELISQITQAGHDTEEAKASDGAYNALPKCCHYRKPSLNPDPKISDSKNSGEVSFKVNGECGMCHDRIEGVTKKHPGVISSHWDENTKLLTLKVDPNNFNQLELEKEIAKAGHDTENAKAPILAYEALPQCCQYRSISLNGLIFEKDDKGKKQPLIGATIFWMDDPSNGFVTDIDGGFNIPMALPGSKLVVNYIGYVSDTLTIEKPGHVEIILGQGILLDEVNVTYRKRSTEVSYVNPIKVKSISQKELTKAACCNLSESFATNPSVDVSFTDAVTGTRQIEMLGLAGPYVQITRENMPDIRGLSSLYGFTYIPGPWIESIQMNLGTGSVINGFESIAGQINVELKKPWDTEYLHINGYASEGGRYEANVISNTRLNKKWQTNLMLHYNMRSKAHDRNFDGFLDMPKGSAFIAANNYKFEGENGNEGMFGWKYTHTDQTGGQDISHHEGLHPPGYVLWQSPIKSDRIEAWMKRGKVFVSRPYSSIGFQLSGTYHNQKALFGSRNYDATQKMVYANLLYQTIIGSSDHKITMGSSLQAEKYNENLNSTLFERTEIVPGVFGEYTYTSFEKLNIVLGLRADHHNNYGLFLTPRIHSRYAINEFSVLRGSIGRGQRTANIIAENIGFLASSRVFDLQGGANSSNPYGLDAEVAWNYGVNFTRDFPKVLKGVSWSLDLYHTQFVNQIVVDYDSDVRKVSFYNLKGKSYSTSLQTQLDITPIEKFDIRLAYRYNIVKTTFGEQLLNKPLTSPHRAFANFAYEVGSSGWKFDYTVNWQGSKRLPSTSANPLPYQRESQSPSFFMHDAQVTKQFGSLFEFYSGVENVLNFRQKDAIIASAEPFSEYFDSTLVWGPIFGRNIYVGFRYKLSRDSNL